MAAISQAFNNIWIFVFAILTIASISCFNTFGLSVTKFASAAQRSTIDTSRTVLIWMFCLVVPGGLEHEYWNKMHVQFKWL